MSGAERIHTVWSQDKIEAGSTFNLCINVGLHNTTNCDI